jgi:thiol-disulfide isomerase/thioredoxin
MYSAASGQPYVAALVGVFVVLVCAAVRHRGWRGPSLSKSGAAAATGIVTVLMLATAWALGLRESVNVPPLSEHALAMMRERDRVFRNGAGPSVDVIKKSMSDSLLPIGHEIPPLDPAGWINGPAPTRDEMSGKVVVIDIWDYYCPMCTAVAPTLVDIYKQYEEQDVVFVGLTLSNKELAKDYVQENQVPWPTGYEAEETMAALVGVSATLFVVVDGHVVWHDTSARFQHRISDLPERLSSAIDRALDIKSALPNIDFDHLPADPDADRPPSGRVIL